MSSLTNVGPVPASRTDAGEARKPRKSRAGLMLGVLAWLTGIVFIAPILWMVLTSFHSEADAATNPPSIAAPHPSGLPSSSEPRAERAPGRRWPTR